MSYVFRPAITSEAKPLIGLYSESGCGKTYSALLLAKGFAGDMSKVGMIETESGRGEVYADDPVVGGYQVLPLRESFAPKEYGAAITAAGQAGLKVLIIDSASHEWEGAGGVLGMAAANQAAGKKGPIVWQQPKMDHQREFMLRLLQTPVPLVIVCMRAKYPMKEVLNNGKKEWTRSGTLEPKQADDILFEMMVHAWIDQQHSLHVTKYTKEAFRSIFIDNSPITVDTGKRLSAWAAGTSPKPDVSTGAEKDTAIEELLNKEGIDKQLFNDWLTSIQWLPLTRKNKEYIIDNWVKTAKAFSTWVDKNEAANG
jgi:flagellar motor switch/type III secretory pathway protein FliN